MPTLYASTDEPVFLRALELTDLEASLAWHNDPALFASLGAPFRFVSRHAEEAWLKRRVEYSDREVNSAICLRDSGTHIGNIYLRDIDWRALNAALGLFIGDPTYRGKGYGTCALRLMVRHAFRDLGLHRVYLHALAENAPAIRSYLRVGFVQEGTLRDHAFKNGRFHDVVVLGLLPAEFSATTGRQTSPTPTPASA